MKENSIDDVEKYPALIAVNNILGTLRRNEQRYIRSFLGDFKISLKNLRLIHNYVKDRNMNNYLLKLVREDYLKRIDEIHPKYEEDLKTHMKNYVFAKTRELIKNKTKIK
jgi:hypothetical protein